MTPVRCYGCMTTVAVSPTEPSSNRGGTKLRVRVYDSELCAEFPTTTRTEERDDLIVALHDAGRSDQYIANLAGLSRSGAQRVAKR